MTDKDSGRRAAQSGRVRIVLVVLTAFFMQGTQCSDVRHKTSFADSTDRQWKTSNQIILEKMVRCWRPNPAHTWVYSDKRVVAEMLADLDANLDRLYKETNGDGQLELYPETQWSALDAFGFAKEVMPHHYLVGATNTYVDDFSHCIEFDYTKTGQADPAGCRFFQHSFVPIKEVMKCAHKVVDRDLYYRLRRDIWDRRWQENATKVATDLSQEQKYQSLPEEHRSQEKLLEELALIDKCQKPRMKECDYMTSSDRTLDLLKRLDYSSWDGLSLEEVHKLLDRKMTFTRMAPEDSEIPTLHADSLKKIKKCLKVPDRPSDMASLQTYRAPDLPNLPANVLGKLSADLLTMRQLYKARVQVQNPISEKKNGTHLGNSARKSALERVLQSPGMVSPIPYEALMIKESLACLSQIFDKVEVPRPPYQMLWPVRHDRNQLLRTYKEMHPLCARVGLTAASGFAHGSYASLEGLLWRSLESKVSDNDCFNPVAVSCKTFYMCWMQFMKEELPHITSKCPFVGEKEP